MRKFVSFFIQFAPTFILVWALVSPELASAAPINYVPLQPLPDQPAAGNSDIKTYLIYAFKAGISVAGIMSVLMLVIAGFQYATTDAFSGKEESKAKMTNVFAGLFLILVSYILLNTVNKDTDPLTLDFGADTVHIGGGLTGGLNTLRYNQAQTVLNNNLRASIQAHEASQKDIDALKDEITQLKTITDSMIEGGDPEAMQKLVAQMQDKEREKAVLQEQQDSAYFGAVYQTTYDKAMIEINKTAITQGDYLLAKENFQKSEANYLKLKASLETGNQASKDAAKALELRWNTQSTTYSNKLREVEQKYTSFSGNTPAYTGGNIYLPPR